MRALSLKAASRCETARTNTCRCRCHGALHGSRRPAAGKTPMENFIEEVQPPREYYEALPEDDPHHVRSAEERKRRRKMQRADRKARAGQTSLWPLEA